MELQSPSPPKDWEEAYGLLERLREEASKRRLFAEDRSTDEVRFSIVALFEVNDELAEIAARLLAGPAEFLEILLASPEELRREARFNDLLSSKVAVTAPTEHQEAAVDDILAGDEGLISHDSLEHEQELLLVQEAVRTWGASAKGEQRRSPIRSNYPAAIAELVVGSGAWVAGFSCDFLGSTLVLVAGAFLVADAIFRWDMAVFSRGGRGDRLFSLPYIAFYFRSFLAVGLIFYSMVLGYGSFDTGFRIFFAVLGTVAIWRALGVLYARRGPSRR